MATTDLLCKSFREYMEAQGVLFYDTDDGGYVELDPHMNVWRVVTPYNNAVPMLTGDAVSFLYNYSNPTTPQAVPVPGEQMFRTLVGVTPYHPCFDFG